MTDTPAIDFETAFAELNTLNHLFNHHPSYSIPRLNPAEYEVTVNDDVTVVIRGQRTGLYYLTSRSLGWGGGDYTYAPFVRVRPENQTVVEWVKV